MVEDQKNVTTNTAATTATPVAAVKPSKKARRNKKGCGCENKANQ